MDPLGIDCRHRIYETNSRIFADPIDPKIKNQQQCMYTGVLYTFENSHGPGTLRPTIYKWLAINGMMIPNLYDWEMVGNHHFHPFKGCYRSSRYISRHVVIVYRFLGFAFLKNGDAWAMLGAEGKKQNIFPKWWFNGESPLVERITMEKS